MATQTLSRNEFKKLYHADAAFRDRVDNPEFYCKRHGVRNCSDCVDSNRRYRQIVQGISDSRARGFRLEVKF